MNKGKGSDFSNLGPVGRAEEAVCLSTFGPVQTALCAEVGRNADAAVNHRDINSSSTNTNSLPWHYHEPKASDILMGDYSHCHLSQKDWDARD